MAKKKSNNTKAHDETPHNQTMDDDKVHSLKSLNAMLLKETVERRQQVDSLTQVNSSLESELNRCVSDNASLQSELKRLTDEAVKSEIEKGVLVAVQVEKVGGLVRDLNRVMEEKRVKESEIGDLNSRLSALEGEIGEEKFILSRVYEERDEIRAQLDDRIQIQNTLKSKLAEAENTETVVLEKSRKLRNDYDGLVKEKALVETKMDSILKEKDLVERNLVESNRVIDDLKMEMNKVMKQKTVIEGERDLQEKKKNELQNSVDGLNEVVQKLQEGKARLVNKVAELEKKCAASLDKEVKMSAEIGLLVKEKQDIEMDLQRLTEEKSLVAKDLDDALKSLSNQNLNITQLAAEKTKIDIAKNRAETDVIKLKEQLEEVKNTVTKLEKLSIVQTDKVKQLESEKSRYMAASDQATKERNNARASLDGEIQKVKHLTENISKIEKDTEDLQKKLSKMQKETQKLVAEKKDLENACAALENEILVVKKSLAKTQKEHHDTKGKLRASEANTCKILKILKNTSSSLCNNDKVSIDQETEFGEEIKHHVTHVEAIKKAFKEKESVADEMKKQLELLKVRAAKADKGKSFWAMVSSATTVLAAVSLAYVARGGY